MPRRLALPITLVDGRAVTVDVGSQADLEQSLNLALGTELGERVWAQQVGLASQRGQRRIDPAAIRRAIDAADLRVDDSEVQVDVLTDGPDGVALVRVGPATVEVRV